MMMFCPLAYCISTLTELCLLPFPLSRTSELAPFTGEGGQPIYVGVDGYVFNMSSHEGGPAFYGPGGGYHAFAGK